MRQIYGLGRVRREISRHALAELGSQGFTALAIVHRDGPIRISDVAQALAVDVSVASRQVAALADAGYVTRARDGADRRAQVVETTDDGHRVLVESHRRMVAAFAEVLDDWSDADLAALTQRLQRLNDSFSAHS